MDLVSSLFAREGDRATAHCPQCAAPVSAIWGRRNVIAHMFLAVIVVLVYAGIRVLDVANQRLGLWRCPRCGGATHPPENPGLPGAKNRRYHLHMPDR